MGKNAAIGLTDYCEKLDKIIIDLHFMASVWTAGKITELTSRSLTANQSTAADKWKPKIDAFLESNPQFGTFDEDKQLEDWSETQKLAGSERAGSFVVLTDEVPTKEGTTEILTRLVFFDELDDGAISATIIDEGAGDEEPSKEDMEALRSLLTAEKDEDVEKYADSVQVEADDLKVKWA